MWPNRTKFRKQVGWNGHFIRVAVQFRHMHPQKSEYKVLGLSYTYRRRYNQKGSKNRESGAILMLAQIGQNSFLFREFRWYKATYCNRRDFSYDYLSDSTFVFLFSIW